MKVSSYLGSLPIYFIVREYTCFIVYRVYGLIWNLTLEEVNRLRLAMLEGKLPRWIKGSMKTQDTFPLSGLDAAHKMMKFEPHVVSDRGFGGLEKMSMLYTWRNAYILPEDGLHGFKVRTNHLKMLLRNGISALIEELWTVDGF